MGAIVNAYVIQELYAYTTQNSVGEGRGRDHLGSTRYDSLDRSHLPQYPCTTIAKEVVVIKGIKRT